jgi:RND family efflux transporter MFP subunit
VLDASGYVVAQRQATVSAKNMFKVRELLVEAGQTVKAGDIVARMDDSNIRAALEAAQAQLAQATAGLEAARVALADARPIFERNQQQRAAQVISAQDFDAAKITYDNAQTTYAAQQATVAVARANLAVAQRNEDDTIVKAPFSGVVTDRAAQAGEIVSPMATSGYTRTGICTIVDMDSLEAQVDVSESFINRVRPGQPAVVHLNAYPDWAIPGKVVAIIPTADRSKATVKVRVGFDVRDPRILPEMGARVSFLAEKAEKAEKKG